MSEGMQPSQPHRLFGGQQLHLPDKENLRDNKILSSNMNEFFSFFNRYDYNSTYLKACLSFFTS